jgi:2-C-methyl-D-erythritol 4-phosphate cytidylyltransferase
MSKNIGIIFAGGVGKRMGEQQIPKQFLIVDEKPIIIHTLEYFQGHKSIDAIYIACVADWIDHLNKLIDDYKITKVVTVVPGGDTAQDSIFNGLSRARQDCDGDSTVLIHDGVRPFITFSLISDLIESVEVHGSGITCTPCYETIIISTDEETITDVPLRRNTHSAQAPQAFKLDDVIDAHIKIREVNPGYEDVVDACTMYRQLGKNVHMVLGNRGNIKITKPEDVYILKGLIEYRRNEEILGVSFLDTKNEELK